MEIRHRTLAGVAALAAALAAPLAADDVHLVNGNTFEGVIATVEGSLVKIRLPHGEISLPRSRVLSIDKTDSALEEYLARKAALLAAESPGAEPWLELARWAESHGLPHGRREAALQAARLDPQHPDLEPVLRDLGFLYEADLGRWLPYAEAMHHRGFVYDHGTRAWITREQHDAVLRAEQEERARRRAELAERVAEIALEQAIEARVQAQVAREIAQVGGQRGIVYSVPVAVGTFFPAFFPAHPGHHPTPPAAPEAPAAESPGETVNSFAPPLSRTLMERDFGAGLGVGLPHGWGGAPGRLRQATSSP